MTTTKRPRKDHASELGGMILPDLPDEMWVHIVASGFAPGESIASFLLAVSVTRRFKSCIYEAVCRVHKNSTRLFQDMINALAHTFASDKSFPCMSLYLRMNTKLWRCTSQLYRHLPVETDARALVFAMSSHVPQHDIFKFIDDSISAGRKPLLGLKNAGVGLEHMDVTDYLKGGVSRGILAALERQDYILASELLARADQTCSTMTRVMSFILKLNCTVVSKELNDIIQRVYLHVDESSWYTNEILENVIDGNINVINAVFRAADQRFELNSVNYNGRGYYFLIYGHDCTKIMAILRWMASTRKLPEVNEQWTWLLKRVLYGTTLTRSSLSRAFPYFAAAGVHAVQLALEHAPKKMKGPIKFAAELLDMYPYLIELHDNDEVFTPDKQTKISQSYRLAKDENKADVKGALVMAIYQRNSKACLSLLEKNGYEIPQHLGSSAKVGLEFCRAACAMRRCLTDEEN